jgi:hypothetical protein
MSTLEPLETVAVDESTMAPTPGRRRIPRGLTVAAAVVVLAMVGGGVAAVTRNRSADEDRPVDVRARDVAVRIILKHRAAAVLAHDQRAWLADVDPLSARFQRQQHTVFANLKQVDFASWRYEVVNSEFSAPHLARKYDAPYILKPLLLHYAIKGYDLGPVARPQVLTFVRRGDRWYLASDSDVDADLPVSGHADPWDRRAMVSVEGENVLLLADAQDKDRLGALVSAGDAAVARVAKMWPDGWRRKIVIVAVRDPLLIETYFPPLSGSSSEVSAIAAPSYDGVAGWTPTNSTPYDARSDAQPRSRIILNPRYFNPHDSGNANLLTHEITHVATQAQTGAGAPTWLVEGAAEYTAYRELWPFPITLPATLAAQVTKGSVYLPTYTFYEHDVSANYLAGLLACAYVAHHYGEATLRRYYSRLAATPSVIQTLGRTRRVTRKVLGLSTEQLQRRIAIYAASPG